MPTPGLTKPNPELSRLVAATVPGMAHWSGTGPQGATCGMCSFWRTIGDGGKRKLKRCGKYVTLTLKIGPEPIPAKTLACRHFELQKSDGGKF